MTSFIDFCLWAFALFGFGITLAQIWAMIWPNGIIARRLRSAPAPAPGANRERWNDLIEMQQRILDVMNRQRETLVEIREQRALSPPVLEVVGTVQRRRTRANHAADGSQGPTQ